jgi:prophage regulatory protein
METSKPIRLIDLQEVMRRTGLKRDSIYRLGRQQQMPRPVKVSEWASRWVESEIDDYIADRIADRDAMPSRAASVVPNCAEA